MNMSSADHESELLRREEEIRKRELELRIRELEGELKARENKFQEAVPPHASGTNPEPKAAEPPVTPTSKYDGKRTRWQKWSGKAWLGVQFVGIVVIVVALIRVSTLLGWALMLGMAAWVAYKVFFETD
jgi:hypothetical protein